jgi:hypothetical protein
MPRVVRDGTESRRRSRRLSWVSISFEDRDLVFQDLRLHPWVGASSRDRRGVEGLGFGVGISAMPRVVGDGTESKRRSRRLSWVSISFADRDLVFQDFRLVLVPGVRPLRPRARLGAMRARFARTENENREPRRRAARTCDEVHSLILGCARSAARPRAGRAESSAVGCPETRRPKSLGRPDHDLRLRLGLRELTAQARAIWQRSAGGRPPPVTTRPVNGRAQTPEPAPRTHQTFSRTALLLEPGAIRRYTSGNPDDGVRTGHRPRGSRAAAHEEQVVLPLLYGLWGRAEYECVPRLLGVARIVAGAQ